MMLALAACGSGSSDAAQADRPFGGGPDRPAEEIEWFSELSNQYYSRIGPVLGRPMEGRFVDDSVLLDPLWHDDPELIGWQVGHQGTFLHRTGAHVAVHHRPYPVGAHGRFLEFDCEGTLLRSVDELSLVTGDPYPVLAPRDRAPGTLGIVALERGFLTATRRLYTPKQGHDVEEGTMQMEVFHFAEGSFQGSVLIPGQWLLFDVDPDGWLLAAQSVPVPRFVRLPLDSLFPNAR